MKMKRILPFFLTMIFVVLTMTSCKKDKDDDPDPVKCKLNQLVVHYQENYEGDQYSSTDNIVFSYDSQGRITGWSEGGGDFSISLEYDNNGRVIRFDFMEEGETGEYGLVSWANNEATINLYYDIIDGTPVISNWRTVVIFNQTGQIIRVNELYYNGSWELRYYVLNTWQNNNVIKQEHFEREDLQKSSLVSTPHPSLRSWYQNRVEIRSLREAHAQKSTHNNMVPWSTSTFTYDSKKNSFANQTGLHLLVEGNPAFMAKNNVLTVSEQTVGDTPSTHTFAYTYNEKDYPLTRSTAVVTSWGHWSESWNFSYNCN